jgi:Rps23 Pro-64 3,4-dihydroxylase Tpa1-like proline 4-hydroxylase
VKPPLYRISPKLDVERAARQFRRRGRAHIPHFLEAEGAERLYRFLKGNGAWRLVINQGDKLFELDRAAQAALDPKARAALDQAVHAAARHGFQFRFESIRVPDEEAERAARRDELTAFASFLSSPPTVALLRRITGRKAIGFADAQATAYGLGDFLTGHDDDIPGKDREAAYVFNLTPLWKIEWGGLLAFHGSDGHVAEAFTPGFNALNLFAVPQLHSVTMVSPFAAARRYSVTGWLRRRSGDAASADEGGPRGQLETRQ